MKSSEVEQLRDELAQARDMGSSTPTHAGPYTGPAHGVTEGVSSYLEQLTARRDSEAAMRMPRSQGSWDSEQRRPGSWHSGVGNLTAPGIGRQTTIGVGRPLIQQRGL